MFNGVLALICGSRQKNASKMSLISGLLLYPALLYPGLTLCCSIVQSTGNRKVALISGSLISGFDCTCGQGGKLHPLLARAKPPLQHVPPAPLSGRSGRICTR